MFIVVDGMEVVGMEWIEIFGFRLILVNGNQEVMYLIYYSCFIIIFFFIKKILSCVVLEVKVNVGKIDFIILYCRKIIKIGDFLILLLGIWCIQMVFLSLCENYIYFFKMVLIVKY